MSAQIENDALEKRRRGKRVVEKCDEKEYYCCGKKVNKNVWELQQLYETTQAKTTKILPEFVERIRFMIVRGITKSTYKNQVDQNGELFNYVLEALLRKIVPKLDEKTGELKTKYDSTKTNLGAYILSSCYWSTVEFNSAKAHFDSLLSCSDFMEDYEKVSEEQEHKEVDELKFISNYDDHDTMMIVVKNLLRGDRK